MRVTVPEDQFAQLAAETTYLDVAGEGTRRHVLPVLLHGHQAAHVVLGVVEFLHELADGGLDRVYVTLYVEGADVTDVRLRHVAVVDLDLGVGSQFV